jgi:penicillin-binding protein 1A
MVLQLMANQGYLTSDEAERWKQYPLPETEPEGEVAQLAPYFEEWVRQILADRFGQEIYRGGFRVYTTLDIEMQKAAQAAMEAGWAEIEADSVSFRHPRYADFDTVATFPGQTPYLQGAFIALDPETGHVMALIGGRDFEQSKFDRARLARRQAGSSFKPFVYTAAIATGIPASFVLEDNAVVYPQLSGEDWRPSNFTEEFRGPMTIREGLYTSTNMIAIKLGWEEVGIETVAQTARRMGIQTEIERFPSTTIGAAEVIPLQVAEAYSTYPNMGTKVRPFPILRVEDANGNVVWEPQPERTTVLDSLPTRIVVDMLEDVVRRGTGYTAIRVRAGLPYDVPAAGKTGTTNDGTDVWFTGFTPNLLATVWFGMDSPQPIFRLGGGRRQATGGGLAAPVWGAFMRRVYEGADADVDAGIFEDQPPLLPVPEEWSIPEGLNTVLVDRKTGLLASRWCPEEDQYLEYYIPGTEPTELCDRSSRRFRFPRIRGDR